MNSRAKGKNGELEAAHFLQEIGFSTYRTAQRCGRETADIAGVDGLHIEVKRREKVSIEEWLQQAERDSTGTYNLPVVMHRRNREGWKITLRAADFFELWKRLNIFDDLQKGRNR